MYNKSINNQLERVKDMTSIELTTIDKANVDIENGTVILTGIDISEVISEIGAVELLRDMDYGIIKEFVAENEAELKEIEEDEKANR